MSEQDLPSGAHGDRIDADAVCEQCGSVNPEDTLLCKTCGNNLRDQRVRRIESGGAHPSDTATDGISKAAILRALGAVAGLVLILLVAFNAEEIMSPVVSSELEEGFDPFIYWTSTGERAFGGMSDDLQNNRLTRADMAASESVKEQPPSFEGRYYFRQADNTSGPVVGEGWMRKQGGRLIFAARLASGAEIRGIASERGATGVICEEAGILIDGEYYIGFGMMQREEDGTYRCHCGWEDSDRNYALTGYRVPSSVPAPAPEATEGEAETP